MFIASLENMPGRVDTPVDAGIKVSSVEFIPDILDIRYRENNRAAPPVVPCYPPSDEDGPTDFDFEIYASNSMANYEPPPPPSIPFSAPFEDYYGEAIGVDYISREEQPANSLLRFLDSLNAKKVEEGGKKTKKHLFSSSSMDMTEKHIAEGIDGRQNTQENNSGSGCSNISTYVKANSEENASSPSIRAIEEITEQPSISTAMSETNSTDGRSLIVEDSPHPGSPTVVATKIKSQASGRSPLSQTIVQEQPRDSKRSDDLKRRTSSLLTVEEAQVKDNSPSGIHTESRSSAIFSDAETPTLPQDKSSERSKGNLRQARDNRALIESKSWENAEVPDDMHLEHVDGVASVDMEKESLTSTQAMVSFKETLQPMSQFYVPQEGDLVLGAVTLINDQKVDLEIGAELSALMPLRDLQPLLQHTGSMYFEISNEDGLSVPLGESLLVKDDALSSCSCSGMVDIGTIVVAEVIGKTIIDGRAILSCKSAAQKLAWHRIDQLMRLGEAVQMKITQWNEGGLLGSFEGVRAFIPRSELLQKMESTAVLRNYVGKTLSVAVVQTDRQTSNIIASEVKAWMSKNLQLGTVHIVTVTRVHTYGMQVEIDNTRIRGFVHKTNFSKEYVSSAANYFAEGDKARVMLIKGRDPTKVSFSLADLEKENGLLLRDKEQVFRDAEEMGSRYRERLSEQEKLLYGVAGSEMRLDYCDSEVANLAWLHIQNAVL